MSSPDSLVTLGYARYETRNALSFVLVSINGKYGANNLNEPVIGISCNDKVFHCILKPEVAYSPSEGEYLVTTDDIISVPCIGKPPGWFAVYSLENWLTLLLIPLDINSPLPPSNITCSGIKLAGQPADADASWLTPYYNVVVKDFNPAKSVHWMHRADNLIAAIALRQLGSI